MKEKCAELRRLHGPAVGAHPQYGCDIKGKFESACERHLPALIDTVEMLAGALEDLLSQTENCDGTAQLYDKDARHALDLYHGRTKRKEPSNGRPHSR